jgi:predicted metalloprotease with PDZ domain
MIPLVLLLAVVTPAQTAAAAPHDARRATTVRSAPIRVSVDATDISRKLFHSTIEIAVRPGPLTLVYPKWIYNAPSRSGLNSIVRLVITGAGRRLPWRRDPLDMFALRLRVPRGVETLTVEMDVLPAQRPAVDPGAATSNLFVLEWHQLVLYPAEAAIDALQVRARITLPPEWGYACALASHGAGDGIVEFPDVSLATLADSPLLAGRHFRETEIRLPGRRPIYVDVAGEQPDDQVVPPDWYRWFGRLEAEAGALFGGYPYSSYRFLLALSDELGHDGLEHLRSSDIRVGTRFFSDERERLAYGYLIPHEYAHAWNGKFRIGRDLVVRNFQQPVAGDLLWVYEGLTRYLNWVLAARSGILSIDESREYGAFLAAQMEHRTGREWRSLQDTATAAQLLYVAPGQWVSQRRDVDFYNESFLVWLEVDVTIRRLSGGTRSLDDFCRLFFQPPNNDPRPRPYVFEDVIAALNHVVRHDWARLLRDRLDATGTGGAPLKGLTESGWQLTYSTEPNAVQMARAAIDHVVEERFSIGMLLDETGKIVDVVGGSAAWKAGLAPGMDVTRVNGQPWSPEVLHRAIDRNRESPIALAVADGSRTLEVGVAANRGVSYPHLERNANPDVIAGILKARATVERRAP